MGVIAFATQKLTPAPQWLDYTAPSYWTITNGSWDGSEYSPSFTGLFLEPAGGWEVDFRPTQIRVTWTLNYAHIKVVVLGDPGATIADSGYTYDQPVLEDLTFGVNDISELQFTGVKGPLWDVTKIEFYG